MAATEPSLVTCPRCRRTQPASACGCVCGNALFVRLQCPACAALTRVERTLARASCSGCGLKLRRTTPPEPMVNLEAMQGQVQLAGRETRSLRLGCWMALMFLPVSVAVPVAIYALLSEPFLAPVLLLFLAAAGVVAACIALPLGAIDRWGRRLDLRRRLATLRREQQADVLLPLRNDRLGDTRELVRPLIRELRAVPTEIAPAAAAGGRGDEPSPAE
jgi:hypothetical protein